MDHGVSMIPRILEILEIEVSNILYNPGNIGKLFFSFSPILDILEIEYFYFLLSCKCERRVGGSFGQVYWASIISVKLFLEFTRFKES